MLSEKESSTKQLSGRADAVQSVQRSSEARSSEVAAAAAAMAKFTQARNPFTNPYIEEPQCRHFYGSPNKDGRIHLGPFSSSQLMDPFVCTTAHSVNAVSFNVLMYTVFATAALSML